MPAATVLIGGSVRGQYQRLRRCECAMKTGRA